MYVIAGLMTLALYQRRHSDTQANPHVAYICFAALVFVVVRRVRGKGGGGGQEARERKRRRVKRSETFV